MDAELRLLAQRLHRARALLKDATHMWPPDKDGLSEAETAMALTLLAVQHIDPEDEVPEL